MYVGTLNCWRPVSPPGSRLTVAPVMKSGALMVALKLPSEVTSPLTVTPFGAFESWASAGRHTRPTRRATMRARDTRVRMGSLLERGCGSRQGPIARHKYEYAVLNSHWLVV